MLNPTGLFDQRLSSSFVPSSLSKISSHAYLTSFLKTSLLVTEFGSSLNTFLNPLLILNSLVAIRTASCDVTVDDLTITFAAHLLLSHEFTIVCGVSCRTVMPLFFSEICEYLGSGSKSVTVTAEFTNGSELVPFNRKTPPSCSNSRISTALRSATAFCSSVQAVEKTMSSELRRIGGRRGVLSNSRSKRAVDSASVSVGTKKGVTFGGLVGDGVTDRVGVAVCEELADGVVEMDGVVEDVGVEEANEEADGGGNGLGLREIDAERDGGRDVDGDGVIVRVGLGVGVCVADTDGLRSTAGGGEGGDAGFLGRPSCTL